MDGRAPIGLLDSVRMLSARDTAKIGVLTGLCAIFIDAVIAHGLFWDNDPYWTYWITKSFLITMVFTIGTAFLGAGVLQGLVITLVHTLILEVYYQWLAPVGLPQEPEWLDFNHLWVTGFPAHYLAILAGYLMAFWIFCRARLRAPVETGFEKAEPHAGGLVLSSMVAVAIILLISAVVTHLLLRGEFPGITYFVQHLLIGFVFIYIWSAFVGVGGWGWVIGALMLSLVWTAYGLYLGPTGLPEYVHYMGYSELWMRAFPGDLVSALIGLFAAIRLLPRLLPRHATLITALLVLLVSTSPRSEAKTMGLPANASAQGEAMQVFGANPYDPHHSVRASGEITIRVTEGGNRWSHVQNTDDVMLVAVFSGPSGDYRVVVDRAMPRHPHGLYTTWNGVVFDHPMHGDTGIGTAKLPLMRPDISLYGWGKVWRNGQLLSSMAPVHAMVTTKGPMRGIMLEVATENRDLQGTPDGYLTVMWLRIAALSMPRDVVQQREIIGWIALIGLTALFLALARQYEPVRQRL